MSEKHSPNEHELFEHIDMAFVDPVLKKLFDDVVVYQESFRSLDAVTPEDAQSAINDLDERWPYMNHLMTITGHGIVVRSDDGEDIVEPGGFVDQEAYSRGFYINFETIEIDGEYVGVKPTVVMAFDGQTKEGEPRRFIARPEEIHIDYPFHSYEHVSNTLHHHYPEIMEDIDTIITSDIHELKLLETLSEYSVVRPADKYAVQFAGQLEQYINENITFDTHVGYVAELQGQAYVLNQPTPAGKDAVAKMPEDFVVPIRIEGVKILPWCNDESEDTSVVRLYPHAVIQVFQGPKTEEPVTLVIALHQIGYIQSLREIIHDRELGAFILADEEADDDTEEDA